MKVWVSITGTQQVDGESETVELSTEGFLSVHDEQTVLTYVERNEEGGELVTTMRCTDVEAQVERSGTQRSLLLLQKGRRCVCEYGTPYGNLTIGVFTRSLHNRLTAQGGTLDMTYTLDMNTGGTIENTLHVEAHPTPASRV